MTTHETVEQRVAHVESLLALARLIAGVPRPLTTKAWFVVMMGGVSGALTVVRVDP